MSDRDALGLKVGESMQFQMWHKNRPTPEGWQDGGDIEGPNGQYSRFISRSGDTNSRGAADGAAGRDNPREAHDE